MYRKILKEIEFWKNRKKRKPLIIEGARQVGKTWVMKQFGVTCFKNTVYIKFKSKEFTHI